MRLFASLVALLVTAACWTVMGQLPGAWAVQIDGAGNTCQEYPVESREERANVVISGFINRIMRKPRTIMYYCSVEVVRVFKGYESLHTNVQPPMQGNSIEIGGFGDPNICHNTVTTGDTRIFMLNKNNAGHLMLNSSVIRITLNNLVEAEAAVLDIPFVTKKPINKGPCDMVLCIFGAVCIENELGRPMCICNKECEELVAPVCGSDGITYLSECFLDRASCEKKRRITVASQGQCDERDPCADVQCSFGSECVEDGERASCICPELCLAEYAPVCGSDGITYGNECEMLVASCTLQKNIVLTSKGECEEYDPCSEVTCSFGAQCVIEGASARCLCPEICLELHFPVCGSDGIDYGNHCEMEVAACVQRKNITVIFEGSCDPCQRVEYENAICKLDRNRLPQPSCQLECPQSDISPVCGSNGITYASECLLSQEACIASLEGVLIVYTEGPCEQGTHPCADHTCHYGQCMVDGAGLPHCVCQSCPEVYHPVCGSDGVTYRSRCHLAEQSCRAANVITEVAEGICSEEVRDLCLSLDCLFGSTCLIEGGEATCSCQIECREGGESTVPVCGSDRIDYPSACSLRRAACAQQRRIQISSVGFCESCDAIICSYGAFCQMTADGPTCTCSDRCQPVNMAVCGSDGKTYASECKLHVMMCTTRKNISVASYGTCEECAGVTCDSERYNQVCYQGTCVCRDSCPAPRSDEDRVCGSDGSTYDGVCHLKAAACRSETNLTVDYYGPCEEFSGSGSEGSGSGDPIDDLCDETSCGFGGVCRPLSVDSYECVCSFNCPAVRLPVCGSDGVTYGNDCQMREAACEQQGSIVLEKIGACEDMEMEPCDGERPLTVDGSSDRYTCHEDNGGEDCPSGSYCHIHPFGIFAVCCAVSGEQTSMPSCAESTFGCCPDNQTEALGENFAGCPSVCSCNPLGSYSMFCEPVTHQCPCKPGVGGLQCDRCEPGYYNFLSLEKTGVGCKPCACSSFGARRDDCDQTTGACICRKRVTGLKCNICPEDTTLTPMGCMTEEERLANTALTCANLTCRYYAQCQEAAVPGGNATCVCPESSSCPTEPSPVCGDNGQTYASRCQLTVMACRSERDILVQNEGGCETVVPIPPEPISGCEVTTYGCCPDQITVAQGPSGAGCAASESDSVIPSTTKVALPMGCDSNPCLHGGTCQNDEIAPGFTCHCPIGKGGPVCEEGVLFDTPSFSGQSYLAYSPVDNAFFNIEIIIEFQPNSTEGVLLYEAQNDFGTGDFISLAIVDGFVEFRFLSTDQSSGFDLGSSEPVTILSTVPIQLLQWHRLRAHRSRRDGTLSVDGEPEVAGTSTGLSSALSLSEELFIGYAIPPNIGLGLAGADQGFVGCIRHVEINGKVLDLSSTSATIEYGANVGECGNDPCKSQPCLHNGTCEILNAETFRCVCTNNYLGPLCGDILVDQCEGNMCYQGSSCVPLPEGGYRCDCPEGWVGELCNEEINQIYIPGFNGNSYIELPSLQIPTSAVIEVEFLTSSAEGMILYNGQTTNGRGDFISLNVRDGHLELRYDLGSNIANVRSVDTIPLNEWLSVRLMRQGRTGEMFINDLPPVTGTSPAGASQLNLHDSLFLGGVRNYNQISRRSGITSGLKGAIRYFAVDDFEYEDLKEMANAEVNVEEFKKDKMNLIPTALPATKSRQLPNEVVTTPTPIMAKPSMTTASVEVINVDDPVRFDGQTSFKYYNGVGKLRRALRTNLITVAFRTDQPDGVLLWNGLGSADFQSVGISDGYAEYAYNLGRGITRIRSGKKVDDNEWHTITITRNLIAASLQVDDETPVFGESRSGASQLDTNGYLYLGRGISVPGSMSSSYISYSGCIGQVLLDEIHLHLYENALGEKPSQFCSRP